MLNKKDSIIYSAVIFLAILFPLSFTKSCKNTDKREILKTALVNPKYERAISKIELSSGGSKILLTKTEKNWLVSENESELTIPAQSRRVENFIKDLISVRNMYKLSDKFSQNSSYGLHSDETFTITYVYNDGSHSIYFGNQDFAQTSRYLMTDKNLHVYEINSSFDTYLTVNSSMWTDPYIVSNEVFGKITEDSVQSSKVFTGNSVTKIADISKFLDLRHGGFADFTVALPEEIEMEINLELGNKASVNFEIYSTNIESEYLVKSEYLGADNSKYYTCSKISSWTYNKIKEIML